MIQARFPASAGSDRCTFLWRCGRVFWLFLPMMLLMECSWLARNEHATILWLGTLVQGCGCLLGFCSWEGMRRPLHSAIIMLYVIALSRLLLGAVGLEHWVLHLAEAILLLT